MHPAAVQPAFERRFAHADYLRGGASRKALDVAQDDRCPPIGGQLGERVIEHAIEFPIE